MVRADVSAAAEGATRSRRCAATPTTSSRGTARRRLPRRSLFGAFFDGLDTGLWLGGPDGEQALADASAVLPGGTPEFRDASTLHPLTEARGRVHLTRRSVSCCYYFHLDEAGEACFTCARTTDGERQRRAAESDEP